MKKQFIEYLQNSLNEKQSILSANTLSEEDKTLLSNQVANLEELIKKLEETDEEITSEQMEEVKNEINALTDKITALSEKINLNKNNEENKKEIKMNYLQSKNALHDFASAIKASQNADEFRKNWHEYLLTNAADPAYTETINIEEGSESAFIPEAVKGMINDLFDRNAGILKKLHYTGAKRFQVRHNISSQDRESSRAKGWTKKTKKAVEELDFAAKLIDNQVIYKIACIDIKTRFDSDEALIQYVIGELVDQILYEIKRCLFHPEGDGRQDGDPYKITSIENLYNAETIGNGEYATVTNFNADFLVDDVRTMVDTVFNPNGKETALVMSKSAFRTLSRIQASETSTPVYLPMSQVAEQCGVTEIVLCDFLSDNDMICFIPSEIYVVGENILNPILYTWHEGLENADYWRYECFCGMGINQMKSVGILKARY